MRRDTTPRGVTEDEYEYFNYPDEWNLQDQQESIASAIKDYRSAHDMTRAELARLLGCTEATVRRYEDGEQLPSPARAARIREVFGLEPEDFREGLPGF